MTLLLCPAERPITLLPGLIESARLERLKALGAVADGDLLEAARLRPEALASSLTRCGLPHADAESVASDCAPPAYRLRYLLWLWQSGSTVRVRTAAIATGLAWFEMMVDTRGQQQGRQRRLTHHANSITAQGPRV